MNEPLILVPLDGSARANAALPVAKALGETIGACVRIIHVTPGTPLPLAALAERLGLERAGLSGWSLDAGVGEPAAAILAASQAPGVRLIVLCTHTAADRPTAILGRTAVDVLRGAPCPVVLVSPARRFESWWPKRILLPYDGSPPSNAAVRPAAELARQADAELIVLQVGMAGGARAAPGSLAMPRYVDQPQHEWPSWTGELLNRLSCLYPNGGLRAHLHVRGGEPSREIVKLAADEAADLIILSWKGEWNREHAKTLKSIVRDAPCPVMIVRALNGGARLGRPPPAEAPQRAGLPQSGPAMRRGP